MSSNAQRGTNQVAVRSYNERLLLQLVRRHGEMTKAEATRASGLSANAISVIFRALEESGLLVRGDRIFGRIGQPSTPMRINPDAHRYVSLKIGRRSAELAVIDFIGEILAHRQQAYSYPTPTNVMDFVVRMLTPVLRSARTPRGKVTGMAVAMPYELWSWTGEFGAPQEQLQAWRDFDIKKTLSERVPWAVVVENDGTAACRAEQILANTPRNRTGSTSLWAPSLEAASCLMEASFLADEATLVALGRCMCRTWPAVTDFSTMRP